MYYSALLLTVAKKQVCAPVAHKTYFKTSGTNIYFIENVFFAKF